MDSVSQLVLGAGVAHLVLGPRIGRRALLLGAVLGTLPDLDVLVRYDSAVDSFTRHRSWSHSLLVLTLLTPALAWVSRRVMKEHGGTGRWLLAVWLVLFTHPILDAFTLYGTQLWWPLASTPVSWGSMFIIDPLFTLPVLIGVGLAWWRGSGRLPTLIGLLIGCTWIGWSLVAQQQARQVAVAELARQGVEVESLILAPFPFSLLWRYVVLTDGGYLEGYYSLLDDDTRIPFTAHVKGDELVGSLDAPSEAERLRWFTGDFVRFEARNDVLVASDLRIGAEGFYVFEFELARSTDAQGWQAITPVKLPPRMDASMLSAVGRRMWDDSVDLSTVPIR